MGDVITIAKNTRISADFEIDDIAKVRNLTDAKSYLAYCSIMLQNAELDFQDAKDEWDAAVEKLAELQEGK